MTRVKRSRRLGPGRRGQVGLAGRLGGDQTSGPVRPAPNGQVVDQGRSRTGAGGGQQVQDGGPVRRRTPRNRCRCRWWSRREHGPGCGSPAMTTLAAADKVASRVAASWTAERRSTAMVSRPCSRFSGWRIISWSVRAVDAQCTRRRSSPMPVLAESVELVADVDPRRAAGRACRGRAQPARPRPDGIHPRVDREGRDRDSRSVPTRVSPKGSDSSSCSGPSSNTPRRDVGRE